METMTICLIVISVLLLVVAVVFIVCSVMLKGKIRTQKEFYDAREKEREESRKALSEEREKAFEAQRKQMEESFRTLSEQNSAGLRRQNMESISELLKPIGEKFGQFDKAVQDSRISAASRDAAMQELIKNMMENSRSVGEEARNLANALSGRSKVQGDFGEMLLTDILKSAGFTEGIHFSTQEVIRDEQGHEIRSEEGRRMIPDVILYYPDDTEVIVDSKLSLTDYRRYLDAKTVEERDKYARAHIESITKHIDELKSKDYASYIPKNHRKVDFNIMFVPVEGAFTLMLEEAPLLWQQAKDAKVLIVSQMNLIIVLNMILMSWKQHDQQQNIAEVYKTASELMGQLRDWMKAFTNVGDHLSKASAAYNEAKAKLTDSNQSVINKIDRMEKMGLSPRRSRGKIKSSAKNMRGGYESVIPSELAENLSSAEVQPEEIDLQEETINETSNE